jgi:biopolymer transport protein ExbD
MSAHFSLHRCVAFLGLAVLVLGCGKPQSSENTSPSQPAPAATQPTQPLTTHREIAGKPATNTKPIDTGPAILTLRANGVLLGADGKSFDSKEEAELFLKQERARSKTPRTIFRAEKETDAPRVRNALSLYAKAGFREVELREAGDTAKKGPVLTLAEPAKMPKGLEDIDPSKPSEPDLSLPAQMTIVVRANPSGSQAGQVRDIVFRTVSEETAFPRGKWREMLPQKLKALIEGQEISNKESCVIEADTKLTYGALLEVVEMCSSAGIKYIELAIGRKGRAE